jgi:RimJ/RimL family protein N-acetyltransferase
MDELVGSFELTAMQQAGVVTEGFGEAPYTDMHYNPPHIPGLLAAHGYRPAIPMTTWETDLTAFDPDGLLGPKQRQLLAAPALRWETLTRRGFRRRMEDVRTVLNDGFADNPMFVPLTSEEFQYQAAEMMWIVDPRIASLVYADEEPVGAVVCIPDLNPFLRDTGSRFGLTAPFHFLRHRMRRRRAVIIFYSVSRSQHGRGLAGAMLHRVTRALKDAGYERLGTTWIADENPASLRQMEKLGARPLHRLHLFRKELRHQEREERETEP